MKTEKMIQPQAYGAWPVKQMVANEATHPVLKSSHDTSRTTA